MHPLRYTTCFVLAIACVTGQNTLAQDTAKPAPRIAVLVGVEKYANLSKGEQLDGCANDVAAMRALLVDRFDFKDQQITTLVNEQATGDAIRAALAKLAEQVRKLPADSPPAQIVFHFSGHGSQVQDQTTGAQRDEIDGLDETLVPHDATKQGGDEDIRDDELFQYVEDICGNNRAKMWLVLDCCHSGSGARGVTKLRKLHRSLPVTAQSSESDAAIVKRKLPPGAVMLAACRAREVEPEYEEDGKHYGLLTRFLVQVLNEEENVTKLSYSLLRESIVSRYRQDSSVTQSPVPQLEGDGKLLNGGILGSIGVDRPRHWDVRKHGTDRSVALIRAGAFHGITVGSIYEVYVVADEIELEGELAGNNGPSVAWLRVEEAEGATAKAHVFQWDGEQQTDARLPASFSRGYAVERFHESAGFELRLRVMTTGPDAITLGPDSKDVPPAIREAISAANKEGESSWLKWGTSDESCDVVLRIDGNYAALFPATGLAYVSGQLEKTRGDVPRSLVGGWGPFDTRTGKSHASDEEKGQPLAVYLRSITRARNLIRLSSAQLALGSASRGGGKSPIQVKLELVEVDSLEEDGFTPKKWNAWKKEDESLVMRDGAIYAFRVTNVDTTGKPVYVSVLSIDSNMGIDQVLPFQDGPELIGEQALAPGASRLTDVFECDAKSFPGQRTAIVLATREPNDFYMLSQPSLPTTRGAAQTRNRSLNNLLMQQTYFKPQTRGDRRRRPVKLYDDSWSTSSVQWLALPTDR